MDGSSRFVTKDVLTFALFSYVTDAAAGKAVTKEEEEEENRVKVGAKRKKRMPFST